MQYILGGSILKDRKMESSDADDEAKSHRSRSCLSGLLLWSGRTRTSRSSGRMAQAGMEKARPTQAGSFDNKRMPRTLRCAECRSRCHARENDMARKYIEGGSIPITSRLGYAQQEPGSSRGHSKRVASSRPRRSSVALTCSQCSRHDSPLFQIRAHNLDHIVCGRVAHVCGVGKGGGRERLRSRFFGREVSDI